LHFLFFILTYVSSTIAGVLACNLVTFLVMTRCTVKSFQTAGSGLLDVSKDGRLAVDGMLQVFDLHSGLVVVSFFRHHTSSHDTGLVTDDCVELARLTADGKYVVRLHRHDHNHR